MRNLLRLRRGCSSVVERALSMREAPGSIPGISMVPFTHFFTVKILKKHKLESYRRRMFFVF